MPIDQTPYRDRFSPSRKHKKLLFNPSRGLQAAELIEMHSGIMHEVSRIASVLHAEGSILTGAEYFLADNVFNIKAGSVFARGYQHDVAEANLSVGPTETITIGVRIHESIITELEDPTLLDQAAGTRNFNRPGAHRLKMEAFWCREDAVPAGDSFFPLHEVVDGEIVSKTLESPEISGLDQRLAKYDSHSNGSYVVSGMLASFINDDDATREHILSVSEGGAHIDGYIQEFDAARRIRVGWALDTRAINNEPVNFTGDGWYTTRWGPVAELGEVNGQRIVTRTITHGNFVGAQDLLPDSPVISIIAVNQGGTWNGTSFVGGTNYTANTDYTQVGDYISWTPAGAEPGTSTGYTVVYSYQAVITPTISVDRKQIYLSGLRTGSVVSVDYTFYIPRVDRLVIQRDGTLTVLKGTPDSVNPVPPKSSSGLELATIRVAYGVDPEITADFYRAFKMSDIQQLMNRLDNTDYNISMLVLRDSIRNTDVTADKKNIFTDPFTNSAMRDPGSPQNAQTFYGIMEPLIYSTDMMVRNAANISLGYTETIMLQQNGYSKSRQINEFERAVAPPGVMTISPTDYTWTARSITQQEEVDVTFPGGASSVTWERHPNGDWTVYNTLTGRGNSAAQQNDWWTEQTTVTTSNTTTSNSRSVSTRALNETYNIPRINLTVNASKFNANDQVRIKFDNVQVALVNANAQGLVNTTFQLPDNIPSGTKSVQAEGLVSGVVCTTTFRASPQLKVVTETTVRTVTQNSLTIYWTDPLAQTFTAETDMSISSFDVWFENTTAGFVDVMICETLNGYPNTDKVIANTRLNGNQIVNGNWTNIVFPGTVPVKANESYALVLMTSDTNLRVRVAELGKYDLANNRWFTRQNYLQGVLFNSSNAKAWSAIQNEDLMFRIKAATFSLTEQTTTLGTVNVTGVTDFLLMVQTDVQPGTFIEFTADFVTRGDTAILSPNVPFSTETYTGDVTIKCRYRTNNVRVSPIIGGVVQLAAGKAQFPCTYISRKFQFSGTQIKAVLDVSEPSGTRVNVYYKAADKSLVVAGQDLWEKVARNISTDIGTYRYKGATTYALTGYRPAVVLNGLDTVTRKNDVTALAVNEYAWTDVAVPGTRSIYLQVPIIHVPKTWSQSSVNTEFYYNQATLNGEPTRVIAGNTELVKGTLGSLTAGQYAWGVANGTGTARLYVRLPAGEVISGAQNPQDAAYGSNFIRVSYDPDTLAANTIKVAEWVELTRGATQQLDSSYTRVNYASGTGLTLAEGQLLIESTTSSAARRPYARNLRAYVV